MYCFYLPLVLRWRFIEFCKLRYFFRINILLQFPRRIFVLKRPPFDQEMPNCLPTGRISVSCFVQDSINFDKVWIERIILGLKRKIVRTFVVEYVRFWILLPMWTFIIIVTCIYCYINKVISFKYIFEDVRVLLLLLLESFQFRLNTFVSFVQFLFCSPFAV